MYIGIITAACLFAFLLAWMYIDTRRMRIHSEMMDQMFRESVAVCQKRAELRVATTLLEAELARKVDEVSKVKDENGIESRKPSSDQSTTDTQLFKAVDLKLSDLRRIAAQRGFML